MLRDISPGMAIIINILILCLWHFLSYILSSFIGQKHLDYRKRPFRGYKFERYGKFYTENFDIESWYMILPIKVNSEHITVKTLEKSEFSQLKTFLTYTCRSEMCCIINCLYSIFALAANIPHIGFIFAFIIVFANIPFIMSNRYFRFLILKEFAKKRKQREIIEYIEENNPDKYDLDSF